MNGNMINHNDIKLKENGEIDLDNMTEEQLFMHMMRLEHLLQTHGGNMNNAGLVGVDSSDYSENENGMPAT